MAFEQWHNFRSSVHGQRRSIDHAVRMMRQKKLGMAWRKWLAVVQSGHTVKDANRLLRHAVVRMRKRAVAMAFAKWHESGTRSARTLRLMKQALTHMRKS